jgi:ribonucleotide reductase alpha subunit
MKKDIMNLLKKRYFLSEEKSWSEIADRVSSIYPPIHEYIKSMRFIPSSPTLMNANTKGERKGTLSSCFPMRIEDSMTGILDAIKETGIVTKYGGGVGYDFSTLRSSTEGIKGVGGRNSSGPLPFINIFNSVLDGISQMGSRRGAGMSMLDINHVNILNFIEAKHNFRENKFSRFNFSVRIPNWFYDKVKNDPDSIMKVITVVDKKEMDLLDSDGKPVTVGQLWNKIVQYAWQSGEPGIFNSDIAYDRCTVTNVDKHVLANPCLPESVNLLTKEGIRELKDINIGDYIWSKEGWTKVVNKWKTGNKEVYAYHTKAGVFEATSNHEVLSLNNKIEVGEAKSIDILKVDITKLNSSDQLTKEVVSFEKKYSISNKENYEISKVLSKGKHDVYDITVDNKSHTFWCNGFNISNCSEFVNIPYSSCSLASINLSSFVKGGKFDKNEYNILVEEAVTFLNNVIDQNDYPISSIEDITKKIRPIGLGYMGLAHALMKLGYPYDSPEAFEFMKEISYGTTMVGMRFDREKLLADIDKYGVRNSCITSIAPTGTISYLADTTSGIEPDFSLVYDRKIEHEDGYEVVTVADPVFDKFLNTNFPDKKSAILEYVDKNKGSCQKCPDLPEEAQSIFKVAKDLSPDTHIESLAIIANNTSLSVSKTINLPEGTTIEDINAVYLAAQEKGIIGVTVYREGAREGVLLNKGITKTTPIKRPKDLPAKVHHFIMDKQRYYVVVGLFCDDPYEIFTGINFTDSAEIYIPIKVKDGIITKIKRGKYELITEEGSYVLTNGHSDDNVDALTRMISTALRHGCDVSFITDQLLKTRGPLFTFSKALARSLKEYIKDGTRVYGVTCSDCGSSDIIFQDGCPKCAACGYSKCG